MNIDAFLAASAVIQAHTLMALIVLVGGGVQLALPKGTRRHRWTGYFWVAAMALVAVSGFFIHELRLIGPFSPIHLLSAFVLYALWRAIRFARGGQIDQHRRVMMQLYIIGVIITGLFTFFPGRLMYEVFFGG